MYFTLDCGFSSGRLGRLGKRTFGGLKTRSKKETGKGSGPVSVAQTQATVPAHEERAEVTPCDLV